VIKTFYWLVIALIVLAGPTSSLASPRWRSVRSAVSRCCCFSIVGAAVGIVFSRIVAEFILMVFRINEYLGAIGEQGGDTR
jgi:Domain of unknown function (DUF4282)